MANGAEGKLLASRTRNLQQHIRITGSEGYLDIGLWSDNLRMRSNKGKAFQQLPYLDAYVSRRPPQDASFVLQLSNLVNAIRGEEKVLVDGAEGMAAVEVVTRAYGHSVPDRRLARRGRKRRVMEDCASIRMAGPPAHIFAQIA